MIAALLFDMDGTLVDSEPLHHQAWQQALTEQGVPTFSWEQFLRYVGTSNEKVAEDFIAAACLQITVDDLVRKKQRYYLDLIPRIRLLPGVTEILERFAGKYRLAIASSSHRLELTRLLAVFGLESSFEVVVGGDMVMKRKPEPDIYLEACRLLNLPPQRCAAFEDSEAGVLAAKRAGLTVIAVPNASTEGHDYSLADLVIPRIDQVDMGRLAVFIPRNEPLSVPR